MRSLFRRKAKEALVLLLVSILISSCGDVGDSVDLADSGDASEIQLLAKEFAPNGVLSENDSLVVFDFDEEVVITKDGRFKFSDVGILAQTTEEPKDEEYRRVATKFGTQSKPFTKIVASIKLPEADDLDWLNDSSQDAVFNYFGLLTRDGVKVDFGLQSTVVDGVPAGSWYPFINFFPGAGQPREFQAWPEDVIAPGTELTMELEAVPDAKPQVPGETPGLIFRALSLNGSGLIVIARGGNVSGVELDGVDQAFRRVTSFVTRSRNANARMCGTRWNDTLVGNDDSLERLTATLAATEPDGNLELVHSTDGTVVREDQPYFAETVDLRCNTVALVVDTTGSMLGEIQAVKLALFTFLETGIFTNHVWQWSMTTFKDSSNSFGLTTDRETIKSWVSQLGASGGGDCPEDSLGAVSLTAETIKDTGGAKSMILVTDASPRTSNPAEVTARLNELDIRLYVLLTGDCVASTSSVRAQGILSARDVFSKMAQDTGGKYVYLPGGSSADFAAVLEEFFEEASTGTSDTEPPQISASVTPETLWPPNHKMVEVLYTLNVSDNQDPNPITDVVGISVNEPDDIQGSGNTEGDFEITEDGRVFVRAERSGTGKRRVYTVTFKAEDRSGNTGFASVDIVVPHDKGR